MITLHNNDPASGSFRDPHGFVFRREGRLYRQINRSYQQQYEMLMHSGLYQTLVDAAMLVPHQEVAVDAEIPEGAYEVIQPEQIAFISYPYEWSFSQLKHAALLTLRIQKTALQFGMSLKDGSAYNVQFHRGKPIFIDTLSFEPYQEGRPWVAYRQFCQHFLAPLALMSWTDIRLNQLLRIYLDGVPLDLASTLLPFRTWFRPTVFLHLHLHARAQKHFARSSPSVGTRRRLNRQALLGLIDTLETGVRAFTWRPRGTEWAEYYADTNYSPAAQRHKYELVQASLAEIQPRQVWDIGANIGLFSLIPASCNIPTIAWDLDPAAVEKLYLDCVTHHRTTLLPLLLDLTNPSPGLGWENQERLSFQERGPVDLMLALALIHHLAIGNNVPLFRIAHYFSLLCQWLVIEFVPKHDSQVQRLFAYREDVFDRYTQLDFEACFSHYFTIVQCFPIHESARWLYVMRRKETLS